LASQFVVVVDLEADAMDADVVAHRGHHGIEQLADPRRLPQGDPKTRRGHELGEP
jgi:hypothetical protein